MSEKAKKFLLRHILSIALLIYMEVISVMDHNRTAMLISVGYAALIFLGEWYLFSIIRFFRDRNREEEEKEKKLEIKETIRKKKGRKK